jgi:hypothetical protein
VLCGLSPSAGDPPGQRPEADARSPADHDLDACVAVAIDDTTGGDDVLAARGRHHDLSLDVERERVVGKVDLVERSEHGLAHALVALREQGLQHFLRHSPADLAECGDRRFLCLRIVIVQ